MRRTILSGVTEREGQPTAGQRLSAFVQWHGPMLLFLPIVWWMAVQQHTIGHSWGDDFALYVRQAKSLFDGNIGQVIADNHFDVNNAAKPGFSPYVYPWGWPLLLSPFVRAFGLDYAKLKLVEVACFCGFLWVFHDLVRRRSNRWMAFGVVAAIGTTLAFLVHTDHLLSEFPYLLAVVTTLWWLDRCRAVHHRLHMATRNQLVVLGLLMVLVFNVRREGLALLPAVAVVQLLDLRGRWNVADRRRIATTYVTFFVGVVVFQLLLPSAIAPSYDDAGLHQTWKKLQGPFRISFGDQLGLHGLHGIALLLMFLLVAAGVVVRVVRAPSTDAPWAVFAVGSMTIAGMIPAVAGRYLMGATPFAVYFAAQAIASLPLPRRAGRWMAVGGLALLTAWHMPSVADQIGRANDARERGGGMADGPESPYAQAGWSAIRTYTHGDDVIAFFKVRALALYTDRRGVQSSDLEVVRQRADYYLMRKGMEGGQPLVTVPEGTAMGWTVVWQDPSWVLWKLGAAPTP